MKGVTFALLVVMVTAAMVQFMTKPSEAAITCGQVDAALTPCIVYLTRGGTPSVQCCSGVRRLKSISASRPDRQAACSCIKQAAARYRTIRGDTAIALPQKCGVQSNIPISPTVDCRRVL